MVNNPTNINKAKLSSELTERTRYVLAWDSHTNVAGLNRVLYYEKLKLSFPIYINSTFLKYMTWVKTPQRNIRHHGSYM